MFFTTGYKYEPLIDYSIKVIRIVVLSQNIYLLYGDLHKKFYNVEFDPGSG